MRKTYRVLCLFCAVCYDMKKVFVALFYKGSVRIGVVECKSNVCDFNMFVYKYYKRISMWRYVCGTCWSLCMWC